MKCWVGELIHALRVVNGMTQDALGKEVGKSQGWISKMEAGAKDPGFHEVETMVRVLGGDLVELVRNGGPIKKVVLQMLPPQQANG